MYRPEDRSRHVQQKLRVINAPTIGLARRMLKAHKKNYCDSAEQRTANPRGTESPVRGSDVELGGRNRRPMSNDPPLTNPGRSHKSGRKRNQEADRKRENKSQVEEVSKDQRQRRTPEAKSSSRHDRTSIGRIANTR